MLEYWLSCHKFTCLVLVEHGVIKVAAPIVKKFEGQHIDKLRYWMKNKFGGFKEEIWH